MSERSDKERGMSDVLKKLINTGVGAALLTEDVVRNLITDISDPKELIQNLTQSAKNTKSDFVNSIKKEFKDYLDRIDLSKELRKVLEEYDVEVSAQFRFKRKTPLQQEENSERTEQDQPGDPVATTKKKKRHPA